MTRHWLLFLTITASLLATTAGAAPTISIAPGSTPAGGYLPLSLFGISPISFGDDEIKGFDVSPFSYAGEVWSHIGISSNGYIIVGNGSGLADNSINNQSFPNSSAPNNVLAPFWTDLNPSSAGAIRLGNLTDGADTWVVVDWEGVKEFSSAAVASFQVWLGIVGDAHPGEDITFGYGTIQGNGDLGLLTVGAEDKTGTVGANYYYNGTGTLPGNGTQLRITTRDFAPVPEPTTVVLLGVALAGLAVSRRKST